MLANIPVKYKVYILGYTLLYMFKIFHSAFFMFSMIKNGQHLVLGEKKDPNKYIRMSFSSISESFPFKPKFLNFLMESLQ